MTRIRPELGSPGNLEATITGRLGGYTSSFQPAPAEHTWELQWPHNMRVFQEMRRSDGQVGSLLKAIGLSIESANWTLNTTGVRPAVAEFVERQLGLNQTTGRKPRYRSGVTWKHHLHEALLMLPFGHVFFEQVYAWSPSEPDRYQLRKLGLRLPSTITQIQVARDGGLQGIWQNTPTIDGRLAEEVFIPVERLVGYVLDREGADWTGTSILRTAYKHWLLKDMLMRVDAQASERNGMGIPVMKYDPGTPGAKEEAEQIVADVRAGEAAGIVIPAGQDVGDFQLVGVSGSTVNAIDRMKYHDQQISRSALAMFLDLGHENGARALGETQTDFFLQSLQAVADLIAETATEHVIRDLVEINWGNNEPYPTLTPGDLTNTNTLTPDNLGALVQAGLLTPDERLEEFVRRQNRLPEKTGGTVAPTPPPVVHASDHTERLEKLVARLEALRNV